MKQETSFKTKYAEALNQRRPLCAVVTRYVPTWLYLLFLVPTATQVSGVFGSFIK